VQGWSEGLQQRVDVVEVNWNKDCSKTEVPILNCHHASYFLKMFTSCIVQFVTGVNKKPARPRSMTRKMTGPRGNTDNSVGNKSSSSSRKNNNNTNIVAKH
jgi:hypothetical protein